MAEAMSKDEQIAQAYELLSAATRNYYVKAYSDAVEDFSTVCSILSQIYGPSAKELGKPYLLYAKCLIALGQGENKIMEIPEEEEDGSDEDDVEEEEDNNEKEAAAEDTNGVDKEENAVEEKVAEVDHSLPGTSTGITKSSMDTNGDAEEKEDDDDLQVAWEVLELAVGIFSALPDQAKDLAECHRELAGISFENSNFEAAIKDFKRALDVLEKLPETDFRELAEINYKIGLAYTMLNMFEDAKEALVKACSNLDEVIKAEEAKNPPAQDVIVDLKETKVEIENKIAEVEDYKQQSMEEVKRELSKLVGGHQDSFDPPQVPSDESMPSKPAADISHLIKRKKPDETAGEGSSSAVHLGNLRTVDV